MEMLPLPWRKGILQYTPEMLRCFLRLPEDVFIRHIWFEDGVFKVKLGGTNKGLPEVQEGCEIPYIYLDDLCNY